MRRLSSLFGLALFGCSLAVTDPNAALRPADAADINVDFCAGLDVPTWVAVKNEGRPWIVKPGVFQQRYSVAVSPKAIVAYGRTFPSSSHVTVLFLTAEELQRASCGALVGSKILYANAAGMGSRDQVFAAMSAGFGFTDPTAVRGSPTQVRIDGAGEGPGDMLAYLVPQSGGRPKYILRHGIDAPHKSLLATLDFSSADATFTGRYPITLDGGESASISATFLSALGTERALGVTSVVNGSGSYIALPPPLLTTGDLHKQTVMVADGRRASAYLASPGELSVMLGPLLATPAMTTVATTPTLRMRATLAFQAEYPSFASAKFYQGDFLERSIRVVISAAYLGGSPSQWELEVPELPFLENDALLKDGPEIQWQVEAWNSTAALLFGNGGAMDGAVVRCAIAMSPNALSSLAARGCRSPLVSFAPSAPPETGGPSLSP